MTRSVYCDDSQPGITRKKVRHGWGYWDARRQAHHRPRRDRPAERDRPAARLSRRLVLPEAATAISRRSAGTTRAASNIAITPISAPRRKATKYDLLRAVRPVRSPSCARGSRPTCASARMSKERAVAAVVRLLDIGTLRVGNEAYAKANKSFGATTLRNRHADDQRQDAEAAISSAKSGKDARADDHRPARSAASSSKCQDLPGQHLFRYVGDDGRAAPGQLVRRQRLYPRGDGRAISPPSISAPGRRA